MVVYLTGDSDLSKEMYIRDYLKGKDVEYIKLFADDDTKIQELKNAATSLGLFASGKIYDLVDFDEWSKAEKNEFFALDLSANWLTVFVRTQKVGKEVSKLEGKTDILKFEKPNEWEEEKWLNFIISVAKKMGVMCDHSIAQAIFKLTGPDEYALLTELEKLYIYSGTNPRHSDIEEIVYKRTISKLDELCFAISEKRYTLARELVKEITEEYEPVIISYTLGKHFIDLFNILVYVPRKNNYNWTDISKTSKELGIPSPKVARFLGFKFKDSKNTPINHALIYEPKDVRNIIEYLYKFDRRVKLSDDIKLLINTLIVFLENGIAMNEEDTLDL
jgi:DNA polymerase-3 subunit delta